MRLQNLNPLPKKQKRKPLKINVCDIESSKWVNFLVIGFYDGSKFSYFSNLSDFLDFVITNYEGESIFAHFGGKFDFIFLIKEILKDGKYTISDFIPRGSGILSFKMCIGKRNIIFRDSSALLQFSLKTLTENFGVQHKKQEIDYEKITKVTPQLLEYLEYDCKGLYESIEKFSQWELIQKSGLAYTIAGQALRVLRLYLTKPVPALSENIDKIIRGSYFGGRTEIFKPLYLGKKNLNVYDVNSLYPTVMRESKSFPGGFLYETNKFERNKLGFYEASVKVPNMHIPPLGILHDGKYVFPTGNFKGMWTSIELQYATTLGVEIEIHKGFIFEDIGPIFRDFVDDLYAIRQDSKSSSTDKFICKLLLNSCYGRMGLRRDREQIVFGHGEGIKELAELKIGNKTYQLSTKEIKIETFSNVAIASWVTSLARIYMHKKYFSKYPDEIYYTDTDSIHTTRHLEVGEGLGKLKLEYQCKSACYLLPKTYIAGNKIVMKGFDRKKIQNFTWDDFSECLRGDMTRLKITQDPKFATFRTALRQGLLTMTKGGERRIQSRYDKRTIIKKGKNYETIPLVFGG